MRSDYLLVHAQMPLHFALELLESVPNWFDIGVLIEWRVKAIELIRLCADETVAEQQGDAVHNQTACQPRRDAVLFIDEI